MRKIILFFTLLLIPFFGWAQEEITSSDINTVEEKVFNAIDQMDSKELLLFTQGYDLVNDLQDEVAHLYLLNEDDSSNLETVEHLLSGCNKLADFYQENNINHPKIMRLFGAYAYYISLSTEDIRSPLVYFLRFTINNTSNDKEKEKLAAFEKQIKKDFLSVLQD